MRKMVNSLAVTANVWYAKTGRILSDKDGSGYIDQAVVILIAVVLGALLLAGLYALFGDVVLPTLEKKIVDMFNYAG